MICKSCRLGADAIAAAGTSVEIQWGRDKHAECKGCDCQHKVEAQVAGKSVRRPAN